MSQVSCGDFLLLEPALDSLVELVEAAAQVGGVRGFFGHPLGQAGTKDAFMGAGTQEPRPPATGRYPVAMALRYPRNQAVQTQAAQMVAHLPGGQCLGRFPEQ